MQDGSLGHSKWPPISDQWGCRWCVMMLKCSVCLFVGAPTMAAGQELDEVIQTVAPMRANINKLRPGQEESVNVFIKGKG